MAPTTGRRPACPPSLPNKAKMLLGAAFPFSLAAAVVTAAVPPSSGATAPPPAGATSPPCAERLYNGICLPREWPPHRAAFGAKEWPFAVQTPPYLASPPGLIDISLGRQVLSSSPRFIFTPRARAALTARCGRRSCSWTSSCSMRPSPTPRSSTKP